MKELGIYLIQHRLLDINLLLFAVSLNIRKQAHRGLDFFKKNICTHIYIYTRPCLKLNLYHRFYVGALHPVKILSCSNM